MKLKTVLLIFGLIFFSCSQKKDRNAKSEESDLLQKGMITLIFQKVPESTFVPQTENSSLGGRRFFSHIAAFNDSDGISHIIDPKRTPHVDTIHISIKNPKVEIYFERLGLEGISYLFANGDEVLIGYENGNPVVQILNRQTRPLDYKYGTLMYNSIEDGHLSSFEKFFREIPFPKSDRPLSKEELQMFHEGELRKNSILLLENLKNQKVQLDSLYNNRLLSEDIYRYYVKKLEYTNWSRLAMLKELTFRGNPIKASVDENYEGNKFESLFKSDTNSVNLESIIKSGDSLLEFNYYREFVQYHFMPNYIENQTTKYTYRYENFGGSRHSWDDIFDTVQKSGLFPKRVREYLLFEYMDRISRDMPLETMNSYFDKFKDLVDNKTYVDILNSKYQLDSNLSDKLVLLDSLDNKYLLEDIIENNIGKLIFIEFWASWCSPCIEAIPHGNTLRKDYLEKEIVFVSIAIDKSLEQWKSSKALKMRKNLKHEYVLLNPYSSNFMKSNHIWFVPRYILIDKIGNIVNGNAPGPERSEIRGLFYKYLSDNPN